MADDPTPPEGDPPAPDDTPDDLGDAGKKALDSERKARRDAETRARDLEAELAKIREANQTEAEKALEAARAEGRTEAEATLGSRLNQTTLELAVLRTAGSRFADPSDALQFLDTGALVGADGTVDADALKGAVDRLLEAKPYLAAPSAPPSVPRGPRGSDTTGGDMNAFIRRAVGQG